MRMRDLALVLLISPAILLHENVKVAAARTAARKAGEKNGGTVGLALSGGSLTAANICGSVMRGFQQQRVRINGEERPAMEAFDYTSAISGGNFPSILYAFARNTTSDEILDADGINDPSQITLEELETMPENSMFDLFTGTVLFSVLRAIAGSYVYGWDFWPQVVYYHFLEPAGIPFNKQMGTDVKQRDDAKPTPVVETSMVGPEELCYDWLYEHSTQGVADGLASLVTTLPNVDLPGDYQVALDDMVAKVSALLGFELPSEVKEFVRLNNSVILEYVAKHNYQVPIPVVSTPDEISSSFTASRIEFDPTADNRTAEPLNFAPFVASASDSDSLFSLERLLGFGTNLVPIFLRPGSPLISAVPEELQDLLNSPLTSDVPTADGSKRSMCFADGGYSDRTGIPALVKLKVRKIVAVTLVTGGELPTSNDEVFWTIGQLMPFFGLVNRASVLDTGSFTVAHFLNHMFDLHSNGENQLIKLADIMNRQQEAGNPLIATLEDLDVLDNPFWGTESGEKVDLTVIMALGVPKKFADQVPLAAARPAANRNFTENGFFSNADLANVPNHYAQRNINITEDIKDEDGNVIVPIRIAFEIPLEFALDVKEARMTNFLMSWMVKEAWDGLQDADGNTLFGGFKNILEPLEPETAADGVSPTTDETESAPQTLASKDDLSSGAQWYSCSVFARLMGSIGVGSVFLLS